MLISELMLCSRRVESRLDERD